MLLFLAVSVVVATAATAITTAIMANVLVYSPFMLESGEEDVDVVSGPVDEGGSDVEGVEVGMSLILPPTANG